MHILTQEEATRHHALRFLPHAPDWVMHLCTVGDVMGGPVRSLRAVESIGNIVDLLRRYVAIFIYRLYIHICIYIYI